MDYGIVEKQQFFDVVDKLDDSTDDELDFGRKASEDTLRRAAARRRLQQPTQQQRAKAADQPEQRPLSRSVSDSTMALPMQHRTRSHNPAEDAPSATESSSERKRAYAIPSSTDPNSEKGMPRALVPRGLRQTVSDITALQRPTKPVLAKVIGKRKRETPTVVVPEALRVFEDLHFYFFTNNESAPARKMRIAKAREYGATWHQQWNGEITHVILDKSMTFDQLKRWLKLERLPESVIVVNEVYPSDCITYGVLLDPSPIRFAVKGFLPPTIVKVDSMDSDTSLKLKKPARNGLEMGKLIETPPRPDEIAVASSAADRTDEVVNDRSSDTTRVVNSFQASDIDSSKKLDEAIAKAKALHDIYIGEDEDDDRPSSSDAPVSGDEGQLLAKRKGKFATMQEKWQCMQKNTGEKPGNPNVGTIDILQQMADYYGQTADEWRVRAYRKAIATLRTHPIKITTKEEAGALPNIGPRLAEKIEEIAFTTRLRRLENAKAEPMDQVLQTFMGVYGAGIKQATEWVNQGYRTLDELVEKAALTDNQRIGIAHYEDFNSRIPRDEVAKHGVLVRDALRKLDPVYEVIIGGSYRRGAKDCGDIDCIITRPNTGAAHLRNTIIGQLVPQLTAGGFLVANLAMTSRDDGSKWHGASCLPGSSTWRRMDLLLVPSDEIGAALIYFTGNDIFNRSLRLLASTKGMRLNQRGLYKDVMRGKNREKMCEGTLVEGKDEKKIFEALGVPWRPPEHRIC